VGTLQTCARYALSNETANDDVEDVCFVDDSSAVGSLQGVKKWWEYLKAKGSDIGFCANLAKILLIKDSTVELV